MLFAGRCNPALARGIADDADCEGLSGVTLRNFSDGEIYVRYDESIRGHEVFIIQSTPPPGDNWMELLLMVDAARRASARTITAVIPYFGYARQDRKDQPRVSIAARMLARMLEEAGVDRVLTMDLHAAQIQGFFDIPVDHLYGSVVFEEWLDTNPLGAAFRENLVVVAPDVGASKVARAYAKKLGADLALIDKRRPQANEVEIMNIIGDVKGRNCLLIDDLVDTAGTLTSGADALHASGALEIQAFCTHALLSGPAYERIEASALSRLIVTDTVPLRRQSDKIEVITVAPLFADAIHRIYTDESISTLFDD
ncbi:ribose-phosphate diphosphokinase [Rubricoccus marinus]|uniref:ribose-phosphate diphosphokinase n=1 Tax=Rubricoccus marinus TaxID=716817 RepID=A0A259U3Y0_9BACT|nr:ribose-phosphate pyrophosphokinase [Rubricoccus marinus]